MKKKRLIIALIFILGTLSLGYTFLMPRQPVDYAAQLESLPKLVGGDGVAGKFGEPPGPVRTLVAPIEIVDAGGYLDGGTTWVALRDSAGTKVTFCSTQDMFEGEIPPYSLYIGGTHADDESARLPVSRTEALMVRASLGTALAQLDQNKIREILDKEYDVSEREWDICYAWQAANMLARRTRFDLADKVQLEKRIAKMRSADLAQLALRFRVGSVSNRENEWEQLRPVLRGHLIHESKANTKSYLLDLLGPPDPDALSECSSMLNLDGSDFDKVLAYQLTAKEDYFSYLTVDLRSDGVNFRGITSMGGRK